MSRTAVLIAVVLAGGVTSAWAQPIPPRPDPVLMTTVGVPLDPQEYVEAQRFCTDTLAASPLVKAEPRAICGCFAEAWPSHTSKVERLGLVIQRAPDSRDAHEALAVIGQVFGGFHDAVLAELSNHYRAAARDAMTACIATQGKAIAP